MTEELQEQPGTNKFLTTEEDRENALLQAANEANFMNDLILVFANGIITLVLLMLIFSGFFQGFVSSFGIFGLNFLINFIEILAFRLVGVIKIFLVIMTYNQVSRRTKTPYVKTKVNCPFLQKQPFQFTCMPRPVATFPEKLLFRCHIETEWVACQREIVPELLNYLEESENPLIQGRAAWGLGFIGDRKATSTLINHLENQDDKVKLVCTWALGNIRDESAIEPLIHLLINGEQMIQSQASKSLVLIGPTSCSMLIKTAETKLEDPETVCMLIDTIAKTGCEQGVPFIVKLLEHEDDFVQLQSVYSLGDTRQKEAVKHLLEVLNSEDHFLRTAAFDSLNKLNYLTLLGLAEFLNANGDKSVALEVISSMEENFEKSFLKLKQKGHNTEAEVIEDLLTQSIPL